MKRLLIVPIVIVGALASSLLVRHVVEAHQETVVIVHWSNSHPMRDGLMPDMAEAFNRQHHKTASGKLIKVVVVKCDSFVQTDDLVSRIKGAGPADNHCETNSAPADSPTIVTPQSRDELVNINHRAGRTVVDTASPDIAQTWLGIVTYRDMATCLGWPDDPLGYGDILDLRENGWGSHSDCASAAWGSRPLLAFTNPSRSTSGRNVLVSLYSIAADKKPAGLTVADIDRPAVKEYVTEFQRLVDHYMPTTLALNTKIEQGESVGQFFAMPEDSLVSLNLGNEQAIGLDGTPQPVSGSPDLVMIYPKEGSVLNDNPAAVVSAGWVTPEQTAAADVWINYLRSDDQQKMFGSAGFRPASGTGLSVDAKQFTDWGLDPQPPAVTIKPGDLSPDVLDRILSQWGAVKKPTIVTFVVDVSGSMLTNNRIGQVKDGLFHVLDTVATNDGNTDRVGLVTFSDGVAVKMRPQTLADSKLEIADLIRSMEAKGNTALFDAIATGIAISDEAPGSEDTTRAVVVLSDGQANTGRCLSDIVRMKSTDERDVPYCGKIDSPSVEIADIKGTELTVAHVHDVQVFFVGFGESDIAVGRILADATGAEYRESTDEELAAVIEQLSGYV